MKKICFFLILLLLSITCSLAETPALDNPDDFTYALLDDGTALIFNYSGTAESLDIPESLDGYPVSALSDNTFYGNDTLISITIPDSVSIPGGNPFAYCFNLTSINVSAEHPTLATIDGVLIEKNEQRLICYPYAYTAESYSIPEGIRIIGPSAFSSCDSLSSITLPNSVECIRGYAFSRCAALRSITIPEGVECIEDYAFSECNALTDVTLPNSVTTIGANPFCSCPALRNIVVSPDHPVLATIDGVLFKKAEKLLLCYPSGLDKKAYTVPQGICIIGDRAFEGSQLFSVVLPDSVTAIEFFAFNNCSSLVNIVIPDSVTFISGGAFSSCSSLTSVTLPNSITSINSWTFEDCTAMTSIIVPDSVTEINEDAFSGCPNLTLTFPQDSVFVQYAMDNNIPYTHPDQYDWLSK